MDCIFCKIVSGEIPSYKVYEDDDILAFLDIIPVNPGHTLVIPKKHYETILDTPDDVLKNILVVSKRIAQKIMEVTGAEGFNFNQNNFSVSGQVVPHVHFHIIPRFENDGLKLWAGDKYDDGQAEILTKKIRIYND
ncbi:MAG: HIT family protein [Patescibacteria group bacterium]